MSNESKLIELRSSKNNRYTSIYSYGFDNDDSTSSPTNDRPAFDDSRERERDEQL